MSFIAKDLPTLVFMLLPGFIAAGVFFTLTAHPKSSEFERLIQALIFTAILRVMTIGARLTLFFLGNRLVLLGAWSEESEFIWSALLALPVGLFFAAMANWDIFHRFFRKRDVTTRTSYPSEWYSAFAREKRWVILHLSGGRRLYGWPEEWPDQPDRGHFLLTTPEWLLDNNARAPLHRVERFMIPAGDVAMVEFMKQGEEIPQDLEEVAAAGQLLIDAQKETIHGSESTAARAKPPESSDGK